MTTLRFFSPSGDPRLYRCACQRPACDAPDPSETLLLTLDLLRHEYGRAITVTSGPRCLWYDDQQKNRGRVRGAHVYGDAADLACRSSADLYDLMDAAARTGITRLGVGPGFLHVDVSRRPDHPPRRCWTYYATA